MICFSKNKVFHSLYGEGANAILIYSYWFHLPAIVSPTFSHIPPAEGDLTIEHS
jgi:hypothetical protein